MSEDENSREYEPDVHLEALAAPLGSIVIEFNYLEMDLGTLIARLLRQDDMVAGVFGGTLPLLQKLALLRSLVPLKVSDEDLRTELESALDEAKEVNEERNRFVHAELMPLLGADESLVQVLHRRIKDAGKPSDKKGRARDLFQPVHRARLETAARKARDVSQRLRAAAERHSDWLDEHAPQRS